MILNLGKHRHMELKEDYKLILLNTLCQKLKEIIKLMLLSMCNIDA